MTNIVLPLLLSLVAALTAAEELALSGFRIATGGQASVGTASGPLDVRFDSVDSSLSLQPGGGEGAWDLSGWETLLIDIENTAPDRQLRLNVRLRGGEELVAGAALNPGEKRTLRTRLPHPWPIVLPKGVPRPRQIDTAHITAIDFFMQWPFERSAPGVVRCRIGAIRVEGRAQPLRLPAPDAYFPFVDAYGQFMHGDWPGKIRSDDDLRASMVGERAALDASQRPADWNEYGGWKDGPRLAATGSFRVEKVGGKWFFVDPSGCLFFSHGLDVVRAHSDAMKTRGRENWFAAITGEGDWQPIIHNLELTYGTTDYQPQFHALLERRLRHWGFNTVGDWASEAFLATARTPYALQLTDFNWRMPHIGKMKMYDVYDPIYVERMANLLTSEMERTEVAKRSLTDPYCIGYFIDNELAFGRDGQLAQAILACPPAQAAKLELVKWLQARHASIETLNTAWKTTYASWDALLAWREAPEGPGHRADTDPFVAAMVDRYYAICRDAVKRGAPNRLYLGSRFVGTDSVKPWLYEACARHADVLSVNIYAHGAAGFPVQGYPDIPVLIGEFHFGVAQRGMFSPGLCLAGVGDEDRAMAYTRFMQGALVHPLIVGAHWFQFRDQPLLGRGDGEAYQIGFVDTVDRPYPEIIKASRQVGEQMYRYRTAGVLAEFAR